ncbi:DUF4060 family protein [Raoultella planticola]
MLSSGSGSLPPERPTLQHVLLYGAYGRQKAKRTYTVIVEGSKITVEVVNRKCSYVATAMNCARRLRHLPGQCN